MSVLYIALYHMHIEECLVFNSGVNDYLGTDHRGFLPPRSLTLEILFPYYFLFPSFLLYELLPSGLKLLLALKYQHQWMNSIVLFFLLSPDYQ